MLFRSFQANQLCKMLGCKKLTHDGQEGYCSQDCLENHWRIKRKEDRRGGGAECSRSGCNKLSWNGHASGIWCSTACQIATPQSFEATNFHKRYESSKAFESTDQVWAGISTVLRCLYLAEGRDEREVGQFVLRLKTAVREVGVKPEMAHSLDSPALVAVICWTCSEVDSEDREWCSYLQQAVRLDLDECMQAVAEIWRTMNQHIVTRKDSTPVVWPVSNILHRGSRLPEQHVQWFRDAARDRLIYRNKMAISTTKIRSKVTSFMKNWGYPKEEPEVHWKFSLDPAEKCVHVNCLEDVTLMADEAASRHKLECLDRKSVV